MGIERVKNYLKKYNKEDSIYEFDVSSATVPLAAKALGVEESRIAKTLAFATKDGCLLVVAAGDVKVDNKLFKKKFNIKARFLDAESVLRYTGYPIGGVTPFDIDSSCEIYADVSLKRFETIFPACGTANSAVKLTPDELFEIAKCKEWVEVCTVVSDL
ncbi:MAG: YbaK/EbsC family protein [Sphaerochaetaceae bacterium]